MTLQSLSDNRFVLGIGTGRPRGDPKRTIQSMLYRLQSTKNSFKSMTQGSEQLKVPQIFIATLRKGIAKIVIKHADGILLNFCPPEYAQDLIKSLRRVAKELPIVSCYLKVFYSRDEETAKRMLVQEISSYNLNPNYHKMFESAGVADAIAEANSAMVPNKEITLGEKLLKISLANPSKKELASYVSKFSDAGVDLPCLYPYFESSEDEAFKVAKVEEIVQL